MKYLYLPIIICSTFGSICLQAQTYINVNKIGVLPLNVTAQDSIQIFFEVSTPSQSFYLHKTFTKQTGSINIVACYQYNKATIVSHHKDTIDIGKVPQGKYQVKLEAFLSTDSACLNRIDSNTVVDSFMVSSAVSIEEKKWVNQLKVFPNPAQDQFNVSTNQLGVHSIKIYDLFGRLIQEKQFNRFISIPTSVYMEGVYLIKVTNPSFKEEKIHKIVIQH